MLLFTLGHARGHRLAPRTGALPTLGFFELQQPLAQRLQGQAAALGHVLQAGCDNETAATARGLGIESHLQFVLAREQPLALGGLGRAHASARRAAGRYRDLGPRHNHRGNSQQGADPACSPAAAQPAAPAAFR